MKQIIILLIMILITCGMVSASLTDGLIAFYNFEDGYIDATGNGYNGVGNGDNLVIKEGVIGNALYLNGSTDSYVDLGEAWGNFSDKDFTVTMWVNLTKESSYKTVLSKGQTNPGDIVFYKQAGTNFAMYGNGGEIEVANNLYVEGEWIFFVFRRNNSQAYMFLNSSKKMVDATAGNDLNNTHNWIIGASEDGTTRFFNGSIDMLGIYNRSLSYSEIIELYNSGNSLDPTINVTTYVNNSHSNCDDTNSRIEATNSSSPWCDFDGMFASNHVMGGDTVLVASGDYNNPSTKVWYMDNITSNVNVSAVGTVNITSYVESHAVVDNKLWNDVSALYNVPNVWNTSVSGLGTDQPIVYLENNTEFINSECFDTDCAQETYFLDRPNIYRSFGNDTSNEVRVILPDGSNASKISLYIAEEYSSLRIRNNNGSGNVTWSGFTFKFHRRGLDITNSSNIIIENNTFYEGIACMLIRTGNRGKTYIRNNFFYGTHTSDFLNMYVKEAYEESDCIATDGDPNEAIYIYNNTFNKMIGGISLQTNSALDACGSQIYNNIFNNVGYGFASQLEIESYCCNSSWYNNRIYGGGLTGLSLGGANSTTNNCSFFNNIIAVDDSYPYNENVSYESSALKIYRVGGINVVNWNIHHNTFYAKQKCWNDVAYVSEYKSTFNVTYQDNICYTYTDLASSQNLKSGESEDGNFWDYNLYYKENSSQLLFAYWQNNSDNVGYTDLATAVASSDNIGSWDLNSLDTNPLFIDAANFDFTPQDSSPACTMSSTGSYVGALACQAGTAPSTTDLQAVSIASTTATISWTCGESCNYSITLYNNSERNTTNLWQTYNSNIFGTSKSQAVTGLVDNTRYFVNLTVWDSIGNSGINNTLNFSTLNISASIANASASNTAIADAKSALGKLADTFKMLANLLVSAVIIGILLGIMGMGMGLSFDEFVRLVWLFMITGIALAFMLQLMGMVIF